VVNVLSSTIKGWPANGGDVLVLGLDILVWLVRVGYLMKDSIIFIDIFIEYTCESSSQSNY
jgi:hypothetical protein